MISETHERKRIAKKATNKTRDAGSNFSNFN